jgi:NADH dehydrogenase
VQVIEANIHDTAALVEVIAGCDTVINLVAILNETRRDNFRAVHVALPRQIVAACRERGVKRLLHMSALNADAKRGASRYLQSKGEGEDLVHAAAGENLQVTSFRPSVIFGPGDHLFNQFAGLLKKAPGILPLPCPETRFAPVYVGDVVRAFSLALDNKGSYGQRYDLCGPRVYTMRELMAYTARALGLKRDIVGLPDGVARLQARLMQWLPGKPFTMDNYRSLQVDAVCKDEFPSLFDIAPTAVETVVPYYLGRRDQHAMFDAIRERARHDY